MTRYHIGTSGFHYKHWRGAFYPDTLPQTQWLDYYSHRFDTVEINNSFYKLPSESTLLHWAQAVPENFLFSVKGSRFITHNKKLLDPAVHLPRFLAPIRALGDKLGPIVFQLPPAWRLNLTRLEAFLAQWPAALDLAIEFRNPTWHCAAVYDLLRAHRVAFCIFDIGGFTSPLSLTANFTYLRLHGPGAPYWDAYDEPALAGWAAQLQQWSFLEDIYVYFDNDHLGYAAANAARLKMLLAALPGARPLKSTGHSGTLVASMQRPLPGSPLNKDEPA